MNSMIMDIEILKFVAPRKVRKIGFFCCLALVAKKTTRKAKEKFMKNCNI